MLGSQIDLGNPVSTHPLNRGLVAWWLPLPNGAGGTRLYDLLGRFPASLTNGPTWTTSPRAEFPAVLLDGTNDYLAVSPGGTAVPALLQVQAPFTVAAVVYTARRSNYDCVAACTSAFNQTTSKWSFHQNGGAGNKLALDGTGSTRFSASNVPTGQWNFLAAAAETGQTRFNLNGVEETHATGWSGITYGTEGVSLGQWGSANGGYMQGRIAAVWVYSGRALGYVDTLGLWDQYRRGYPDLLRRWSRRAWVFGGAAGGGAGTTLDADPGSITLTGSAASFAVGLSAAPGSFAVTGGPAGFGLALGAAAASLTVSGAAASFGLSLVAGGGTLAVTGADADLLPSGHAVLNADPGVLVLAGSDASFAVGLVGGSGVLSVSGAAAGFGAGLGAAAGSVVVTGYAADLVYSGEIPATPARRYVVPGAYTAARTLPGAYTAARTLPRADLTGGS